jgi:hypothetical protein
MDQEPGTNPETASMDEHALWLAFTGDPHKLMKPMRLVFTRMAVDEMTEYPCLALHDVSIHPPQWDMNFDALIFYVLEDSWIWLVLKYPELATLRYDAKT